MGRKRFLELDEEQRALHDSWDDIARVVFLVSLTSCVIWALCAGLKKAMHLMVDGLLEFVASHGPWLGPLALLGTLVGGGLIRGVLNRWPSWRDAAGDGIDLALGNYHSTYHDDVDDPSPRFRLPAFGLALRKLLATLLTLGTGGSGGLEGPVVLIGESTGAGVARVMASRSEHELRTYQIAGIAAAVASLLNAPFASALFATEIAYGDRVIYRKLAYALLAGTIAYVLNNRVLGYTPVFVAPEHAHTYTLTEYGVTALVAIAVSAPLALGFGLAMKSTRKLVGKVHPVARGAVGGLGTGIVALALYFAVGMDTRHVLGMGEHTLKELLSAHPPADLGAWWFLLLAVLGRTLTTGLTIQSGGSAGLLIPSMFLGGVSGAATCRLLQLVGPFAQLDVALFVVVGIASALVAMVGVPLAAIALVLEIFGTPYGPPAILACGVTYVLTLRLTVYEGQRMSPDPTGDEIGAWEPATEPNANADVRSEQTGSLSETSKSSDQENPPS
ncbi:MAG: chloride channel protein [Myxococcales bacterium]|nr:chloride channel protein [Myxococcales bacterium]MCB9579573.1 chloride channel protein [Polyangiaceae bacterium]